MIALVPFLISLLLMPLVAWAIYKIYDWLLNAQLRKVEEQPLSQAPTAEDVTTEPAPDRMRPENRIQGFRDYVYAFTAGAKPIAGTFNADRTWELSVMELPTGHTIVFGFASSGIVTKLWHIEQQHFFDAQAPDISTLLERKTSRFYEVLESEESEKFHIGSLATPYVFEDTGAGSPVWRR